MAKFVYKLQNILDIKLKMESQAKTQFAAAVSKLREEEEKYDMLVKKRQGYEEEYRAAIAGTLDVTTLNMLKSGIDKTKNDMKAQLVNIKVANKNLDAARERLDNAIKERKIYEKFKENAFEQFKHDLNEQEKKEIDELVSFQYGSETRSGGDLTDG